MQYRGHITTTIAYNLYYNHPAVTIINIIIKNKKNTWWCLDLGLMCAAILVVAAGRKLIYGQRRQCLCGAEVGQSKTVDIKPYYLLNETLKIHIRKRKWNNLFSLIKCTGFQETSWEPLQYCPWSQHLMVTVGTAASDVCIMALKCKRVDLILKTFEGDYLHF